MYKANFPNLDLVCGEKQNHELFCKQLYCMKYCLVNYCKYVKKNSGLKQLFFSHSESQVV